MFECVFFNTHGIIIIGYSGGCHCHPVIITEFFGYIQHFFACLDGFGIFTLKSIALNDCLLYFEYVISSLMLTSKIFCNGSCLKYTVCVKLIKIYLYHFLFYKCLIAYIVLSDGFLLKLLKEKAAFIGKVESCVLYKIV